jgi:glycosyltransferase involved in cell wall biosynthesis
MKISDNLVGVLMMLKNEEQTISVSLNSIKDHFKHLIIYDTGSTDNTIEIIKDFCNKNNLILHLKCVDYFKSFPESRNESICFAETVNVKFLLMMDAGDEFQCTKSKKKFLKIITELPKNINYGLVTQKWKENLKGSIQINDHNDLRFIRNKANCRYDLEFPVHEAFENVTNYASLQGLFVLYQDRIIHGVSTEKRYAKDCEILLKACETKPSKRNYYFLAQSAMSIENWEDGFKYNILSIETNDNKHSAIDEKFTYVRIAYCAMMAKKPIDIIFEWLEKAINYPNQAIDAYVYYFKMCIENNMIEKAVPYIQKAFYMKKPVNESTLVNHEFYDYMRYNLISIVCLMSKQFLDIGKQACLKAIEVRHHPDDLHNINLFSMI